MKFLVLILGSTTLVAGGTAITSQQDVRNNMTAQRPHQEHRAASRGTDCPPVETPVFDNVAHPLILQNPDCEITGPWGDRPFTDLDIDGDNLTDSSNGYYSQHGDGPDCSTNLIFKQPSRKISLNFDTNPSTLVLESYLNVSPEFIQYDGLDLLNYPWSFNIRHVGNIDVTNDGKPDAIIEVSVYIDCHATEALIHTFYVENIFEWPAACASDLNNDGAVEVNDLMQIISNWGECE